MVSGAFQTVDTPSKITTNQEKIGEEEKARERG
jgi:hypothetical protein